MQKLFALYATGVIPASSWIDSDWEGGQARAVTLGNKGGEESWSRAEAISDFSGTNRIQITDTDVEGDVGEMHRKRDWGQFKTDNGLSVKKSKAGREAKLAALKRGKAGATGETPPSKRAPRSLCGDY